ncbi:MAG TPA: hypothetical protein VF715_13555 [Thermoleophilaceae bacterium]
MNRAIDSASARGWSSGTNVYESGISSSRASGSSAAILRGRSSGNSLSSAAQASSTGLWNRFSRSATSIVWRLSTARRYFARSRRTPADSRAGRRYASVTSRGGRPLLIDHPNANGSRWAGRRRISCTVAHTAPGIGPSSSNGLNTGGRKRS